MNIKTKYHGKKEINEDEIFTFPQAIPGFLSEKKFILLSLDDDESFIVLQSIITSDLAFIMTNPFRFFKEYDFNLENPIIDLLEIEAKEDVLVFSILTVYDPFDKTTANLQAPVVINSKKKIAKQVILNHPEYHTKHPLFNKAKSLGEKG